MGIMKKLGKSGMFGLAGLAATNPDITNKIARSGGFGLAGLALAKKKKKAGDGPLISRGPMVEDIMVAEEAPAGAPTMRKGGKVKKMAKGGSTASKRGDGCATKGKTKGRFV
jgi:hypothetical protein